MTKEQTLGQIRAALTAAGTVLATWGINDGNAWAPIVGGIVAVLSVTWGLLHHRDPLTQGQLKWSVLRKCVNVLGSAGITYGLLNPEKVEGVDALLAALGPLLASVWSWIDNEPDTDLDDGPGDIHLLLLIGAVSLLLLPGCAEFPITGRIDTEFGSITTDAKGGLVIRPIPHVIRIPLHEK